MDESPSSGSHTVVLIHGIRTFADWQNRFEDLIKSAQPETKVRLYKYKFFSTFAFLLPPLRKRVVREFREFLEKNSESWRGERVDIFAHSFGTYIVAKALSMLSKGSLRVHTVVLSGSVLKVNFPWDGLIGPDAMVKRVVNDCGSKDIWPLIAQIFVFGMGIAGRYGFVGDTGSDAGLINRFYSFGHSGFFTRTKLYEDKDQFMKEKWLPLLTGDESASGRSDAPKARWFAGYEFAAEPLKIVMVALVCLGAYEGYRTILESMDAADARANLAEANSLLDSNPIEAFLLTIEAGRSLQSNEVKELKQKSLETIYQQAVRRSSHFRRWSSGGFFGRGWFEAEKLGDITYDGDLYLYGERGEARLIHLRDPENSSTLSARCDRPRSQLNTLRFSQSQEKILVARHAFIFVYDIEGELIAKICRWVTKDQWNYLELFQNDSLLLASANEGQIMFFDFRTEDGEGILHPLTGEFEHRERSGGAIVSLDASEDDKFLLSTHHTGSAFLWRFDLEPKPGLAKIREFDLPPELRKQSNQFAFKFGKDDEEFVTSAELFHDGGAFFVVTTYKVGGAVLWSDVSKNAANTKALSHDDSTVMYADFSADGSKIVTLADDRSVKIWDTEKGEVLFAGPGLPDRESGEEKQDSGD